MSEPVFARRRLLTAVASALLAGCSVLPGKAPEKPPALPVAPVAAKPKIGLALGGGSAAGREGGGEGPGGGGGRVPAAAGG